MNLKTGIAPAPDRADKVESRKSRSYIQDEQRIRAMASLTREQRDANVRRFAGDFFEAGTVKRFFDEDRDDSALPADVRDFIAHVRKARTTYSNLAAGVEHIDDDGQLLPYPRHLHPQ
jgi:hypothetical protein